MNSIHWIGLEWDNNHGQPDILSSLSSRIGTIRINARGDRNRYGSFSLVRSVAEARSPVLKEAVSTAE